jgi:hypothetical protein
MRRIKHHKIEYAALINARCRCINPNLAAYPDYGGRGIRVCDEWQGLEGFYRFLDHIGPKPSPELTLDRIDNDPNNVRWASRHEQLKNRRPSKPRNIKRNAAIVSAHLDGEAMNIIAERYELSLSTIHRIVRQR